MPSFSHRCGVPAHREDDRPRRRGRRPGNPPSCRSRLRGWLRNVCRRSPIWGDVDIAAFCELTGYSREHATRELSNIRRDEPEFVFETKQRRRPRRGRKRWGVIVADPAKLRHDRHSLFFDTKGKPLHNYTTLAPEGEKIPPTIPTVVPAMSSCRADSETPVPMQEQSSPRVCDIPYKKEDYFVIQQIKPYGAKRDIGPSRDMIKRSKPKPIPESLRRKAFSLLILLAGCHWDNCKVAFSRSAAFCYALRALIAGHEQERIIGCYEQALFVCHGFAVDETASTGTLTVFNASSTIKKARELLAKDGLSRSQRVTKWYRNHPDISADGPSDIDPTELAKMRAQIAATFPQNASSAPRP